MTGRYQVRSGIYPGVFGADSIGGKYFLNNRALKSIISEEAFFYLLEDRISHPPFLSIHIQDCLTMKLP